MQQKSVCIPDSCSCSLLRRFILLISDGRSGGGGVAVLFTSCNKAAVSASIGGSSTGTSERLRWLCLASRDMEASYATFSCAACRPFAGDRLRCAPSSNSLLRLLPEPNLCLVSCCCAVPRSGDTCLPLARMESAGLSSGLPDWASPEPCSPGSLLLGRARGESFVSPLTSDHAAGG